MEVLLNQRFIKMCERCTESDENESVVLDRNWEKDGKWEKEQREGERDKWRNNWWWSAILWKHLQCRASRLCKHIRGRMFLSEVFSVPDCVMKCLLPARYIYFSHDKCVCSFTSHTTVQLPVTVTVSTILGSFSQNSKASPSITETPLFLSDCPRIHHSLLNVWAENMSRFRKRSFFILFLDPPLCGVRNSFWVVVSLMAPTVNKIAKWNMQFLIKMASFRHFASQKWH